MARGQTRSTHTVTPTPARAARPWRRSGTASAARAGESLGPVLDFMRSLWALDHGLLRASKVMRRRLGVTGPQRLVVRIVGRYPGISAGELASILHLHPSTLTGVLKRLVRRGLLARRPDASDGRRALLALTPRGRALDGLQTGTVEASVRAALRRLEGRDIATAEAVLRAVARRLQVG
jgi:MarR family transcriptional regulator, organic hydroperoxide resistance regulator